MGQKIKDKEKPDDSNIDQNCGAIKGPKYVARAYHTEKQSNGPPPKTNEPIEFCAFGVTFNPRKAKEIGNFIKKPSATSYCTGLLEVFPLYKVI
jgi:hypothetical protein